MEQSTVIDRSSDNQPSWFQDAMKKGLILGVIHILLFLVIYMAFPSKLTGFSYLAIIMAINIGYCIYQGAQFRNQIGGYMDYGFAFKYVFVLLVFNGLLYTVFSIIFLFIDPAFPEMMAQSQLDTSLYWASKMGAPEDAIENMRDQFNEEDITKRYSFSGLLTGFGIVLIFYAIGAAIISLFVRKREPEMM